MMTLFSNTHTVCALLTSEPSRLAEILVAADTPAIYINLTALFGGKVTEARNQCFCFRF
jgi:hypothetical protein